MSGSGGTGGKMGMLHCRRTKNKEMATPNAVNGVNSMEVR